MNISLPGNAKVHTMQSVQADCCPQTENAEKPAVPALVVTEKNSSSETADISPAALERALVRDDEIGKLVNRAFPQVPMKIIDKAVEMLLKADYESKSAIIANMRPSEREMEDQKAGNDRVEKKKELKLAADKSAAKKLGEASADEKRTIERRHELERLKNEFSDGLAQTVNRPV